MEIRMASTTPLKTAESNPKIGIKTADLTTVCAGLSQVLSDTYTLYVKTHGYHWNVTGPNFHSLHKLFEEQYMELREAADILAERIRALGGGAPGSFAEFTAHATVKDNERTADPMEMVRNLMADHETIARLTRPLVDVADEADDPATADLLTARLAAHEFHAWMLRSTAA